MDPSATCRRSRPRTATAASLASYYVVTYLATALPAVVVGVLARLAPLSVAFLVFASVVIAICVAGLAGPIPELRF